MPAANKLKVAFEESIILPSSFNDQALQNRQWETIRKLQATISRALYYLGVK